MPNIDITINNRMYKVSCDAGQEQRLMSLSKWADERVKMIADELGQIGDTRLMLLTLLMVSDELFELKDRLATQNGQGAQIDSDAKSNTTEEDTSQIIDAATSRINALTQRLPPRNIQSESQSGLEGNIVE